MFSCFVMHYYMSYFCNHFDEEERAGSFNCFPDVL